MFRIPTIDEQAIYSYVIALFSPLTVGLLVLIFARSVDRVLYTRLSIEYIYFLWFLSNMLLPIAFLLISWPIVWYKMIFTKDITPEMRKFPQWKFAVMGLFDTMYNLLSTFPQPHLGGAITNVMTQVVLPFNMIGSILFLGTQYRKVHYVGSILVIYGVLVNLLPFFEGTKGDNSQNQYYDPNAFWILVNTVATVFAAASNIYKEIGLKDHDLDVWYTNAWVGVYQLIAGILTMWTLSISSFTDPNPTVAFSEYGNYFLQATKCFFGMDAYDVTTSAPYDCGSQPVLAVFAVFIAFNVTYNMLMLYVFKSGSSVLFVISSAVALPLSDFLYMSSFIAGSATQTFTLYDGFALFILVLAIIIYYSEPEQRVVQADKEHTTLVPATPMFPAPSDERAHHNRQAHTAEHRAPLLRAESTGAGELPF